MASQPKVSILAVSYNHSRYLIETLESIRQQTFQDFELLIADDASTDNSAELIRKWNTTHNRADRLFLHDKNVGLCPTLNEMLRCASGKYLQTIACDDQLLPDGLKNRVDVLDSCPNETAAVYADAKLIDETSVEQPGTFLQKFLKKRPAPIGDLYAQLLHGNFMPAMSVLSRTSCVKEVGAYDEKLQFEDWDLWLRLARKFTFEFDDHPAVRYRLHAANMHKNMKNEAVQNYRILAKHRNVLRARMRIMLTIVRNADEFASAERDVHDFLSWADEYPETRWFRRSYFGHSKITQNVVARMVRTTEGLSRSFSSKIPRPGIRNAA